MVQHGMQRAQAAAQARQRRFCALARDRADGAANTEPQPNASAGISERPLEEEEEKKEREPSHVFPKKSRVEYSDGKGEWQAATVVAVAYDDELVEYYEVNLDSWEDSARSKSTIGKRLRWPATKEVVEVVEEGGGRWDDSMAEEVAEVVVEEVKVPQGRAESGGSVSDRVGGRRDRGVDEAFTRGVLPSSSSLAAAAAAPVDPSPVSPPSLRPSPTHPTGASSSESSEPGAETAEGGKGGGDGGAVGGVVKGAAKSPATKAAPSLVGMRAPVSAFFSGLAGGGMDLGVTAAGGYDVVGGADSSERARELFCGRAASWAPRRTAHDDVRHVDFDEVAPVDVFFAAPRVTGVTSRSRGEQAAAAALYMANVRGVLCSGALVGVVESDFGITLMGDAKFFRDVIGEADRGGYKLLFRHMRPHLYGGAQMRPRLFVLLVRKDVLEAVGEPPLFSAKPASEREPAQTVRSVLEPGLARKSVQVGEVRLRKFPEKVGVCSRVGFVGRGGVSGSVWDVDASAPSEVGAGKSCLFMLDGEPIRLTAREEARLRGIPDSVDIREDAGQMTAKRFVHSSPNVVAVQAVAQGLKEYVHGFRSVGGGRRGAVAEEAEVEEGVVEQGEEVAAARGEAGSGGDGDVEVRSGGDGSSDDGDDGGDDAPLRVRFLPGGRPRPCTKTDCVACDGLDRLLERPRLFEVWRRRASRQYMRCLRREAAQLGEEEQEAAQRVVADHEANARGYRRIWRDGEVVKVPVRHRTPVFWRWRRQAHRVLLRDGAPLYLAHDPVEPTRTTNYTSGSGEVARDFIRGLENDGIVRRISDERAAELKAKGASINPLAMIEKKHIAGQPQKYRMLLDCQRSGVNWRIGAMPSKFPEVIHAVKSVCPAGGWTWSSDMVDMFYAWKVEEEGGELYLIQTLDGYFVFRQLCQGSKSSPHVSLKLLYGANEEFMEDLGCVLPRVQVPGELGFDPEAPPVLFVDEDGKSKEICSWMDDSIGSMDTAQESFDLLIEYLRFYERRGLLIAYPKLELPAQDEVTFGGYEIVTSRGRLEMQLKEPVRVQTHAAVLGALAASGMPSKDIATIAGLLERAAALDIDTRAWVHRIYDFARGRRGWHWWEERSLITKEMRKDFRYWAQALARALVAHIVRERKVHVMWGDSSGTRSGGCVRTESGVVSAWTAQWPKALVAQARGSNYLELRCVLVQLQRLVGQLETTGECEVEGGFVFLFTDNGFTEQVLMHGTASGDATSAIIRAIRKASARLSIKVLVLHVAGTRLIAQGTDGLSRREGPASEGEELDTQSWTAGLAPARPTAAILTLVDEVFGARTLACSPHRAGALAGHSWVVFCHPWHAHFWAETAKVAQVMEPFTTDIVFVLPSRNRAQWIRSFRGFVQMARVRAGECEELWSKDEHEALFFFHMPRWVIPSPCKDKYFRQHGDAAMKAAHVAQREAEGGGEVTRLAGLFQRRLMALQARAASATAAPAAGAAPAVSAASVSSSSLSASASASASGSDLLRAAREEWASASKQAQRAAAPPPPPPPASATSLTPARVAELGAPSPVELPRAMGVPSGLRRVTGNDNVPHLCDPRGNPYLVSEDGTFFQHGDSGGRAVAFDMHVLAALVRDVEDLGGAAMGLPMPVLVRDDGSESKVAWREVRRSA